MAGNLRIGFLGAGKMATALAKGFVQAGGVAASDILASDPVEPARQQFRQDTGIQTTAGNLDVARFARLLFLAVKPDQVLAVLQEVQPAITPDHLLISIAAGVRLLALEHALGAGARVIRVMPNTPALLGAGASAFALGHNARPEDGELAQRLLATVGKAFQVKEALLDAVTGLSGSGPAYAFLVIEALSDGGVAEGLPRDVATQLAAQTVLGAARMVLETGLHPGALKDMVTSPGGTTIEGLHALERARVRSGLINAVRAAAEQSRRLGQS
jgi:pyrroline-5-carboxylate reductase